MRLPWRRPDMGALTSSAALLSVDGKATKGASAKRAEEWQVESWGYVDDIGEVGFVVNFLGNNLSQLRLYPAIDDDPTADPIPLEEALPRAASETTEAFPGIPGVSAETIAICQRELARLRSDQGDLSGILHPLAVNFEAVGECYLIGETRPDDPDNRLPPELRESWDIYSLEEVASEGSGDNITWKVRNENGTWRELDTKRRDDGTVPDTFITRLFVRHSRWRHKAYAPMRGILATCEELLILSRQIRAVGKSRVAQAGMLILPKEISFPVDPTKNDTADPNADPFTEALTEHLVTPIGDEGTASAVVPFILRVPKEFCGSEFIRYIEFTRSVDTWASAERVKLITRIAQALDIPPEVVIGMGDVNHWCVDAATEVLTTRGWCTQENLQIGDTALTLNHDTGLSEWQPVRDIYRADVIDEAMVSMETRNHSSLTTPNHRWPVLRDRQIDGETVRAREIVTTEDLTYAHRLVASAPCADLPTEAKYADDLIELVAWLWTEGHVRPSRTIRIAQSHTVNSARVDRIRAALTRLYGPARPNLRNLAGPGWRESIQENRNSYGGPITVFHLNRAASEPLLDAAPGKRVLPEWVRSLTLAQLHLFIDISAQGDGHHYHAGRLDIWQRERSALDAYDLALTLAGHMVVRGTESGGHRVSPWPQTTVRPVKAADAPGTATITRETYTGTIWCPVTGNGTWLARRRGTTYFTGNTAWQVEESSWTAHMRPLAVKMVDALTTGWYRTLLIAAGVDPALARRIRIWFDPSAVLARPNLDENAQAVYEAGELKGSSLRTHRGFTEDDAPTADDPGKSGRFTEPDPTPDPLEPGPPADDTPAEPETAITASARIADLGTRLGTIDTGLRTRLTTTIDAEINRILDRAGAKLKSRVAGGGTAGRRAGTLHETIRHIPNRNVAATLGPNVVATLSTDPELINADDLTALATRFDTMTRTAQRQALTQIRRHLNLTAQQTESAETTQDDYRSSAWAWLAGAVLAIAVARLYDPSPAAPPLGEHDDGLLVPAGVVREAVARAGGEDVTTEDGALRADTGTRPAGGVATGRTLRDLMATHGTVVTGYIWDYGDASARTRPFEPHEELAGAEFTSWSGPELANTGDFPPVATLSPGDHYGCQCSYSLVLRDNGDPVDDTAPEADEGD